LLTFKYQEDDYKKLLKSINANFTQNFSGDVQFVKTYAYKQWLQLSEQELDECFSKRTVIHVRDCPLEYKWTWDKKSILHLIAVGKKYKVQGIF
jgi:hypothetical protein